MNEESPGGELQEQLAKLLTVVIRQDRFVKGALNGAFESGLLTAIAGRAAELVEQNDKGGVPQRWNAINGSYLPAHY